MEQAATHKWYANPWRIAGWGAAAGLLLVPLVAMQFTNEVDWTVGDFIAAALLIGGPGLAFEAIAYRTGNAAYRTGAALALLVSFLLVWVNLAVGIIGSEDNEINLVFAGVLAVAAGGACIARLRARGMARTMIATALAQAATGIVAWIYDPRVTLFIGILTGMWLIAATLFDRAATRGR